MVEFTGTKSNESTTLKNNTKITAIAILAVLSSVGAAHEAPDTPPEIKDYIDNYLQVFEVEAKFSHSGDVPGIRFAIKNAGDETLTGVRVVVYFLDELGKRFQEQEFRPIWFVDSPSPLVRNNGQPPLRPNYTFRMGYDSYYSVKNLGSEWSGEIEIEIVSVEFAE